jgi:hypothetical protein
MDIGHYGNKAPSVAQSGNDVFQISGMPDGLSRDPNDLTADLCQIKRFLNACFCVERIGSKHRLIYNRMISSDDDTAIAKITDGYFPGFSF